MKKRFIVKNLKECFEFGLNFYHLAQIEAESFKLENAFTDFVHDGYECKFQGSKVLKNGYIISYYTIILPI